LPTVLQIARGAPGAALLTSRQTEALFELGVGADRRFDAIARNSPNYVRLLGPFGASWQIGDGVNEELLSALFE